LDALTKLTKRLGRTVEIRYDLSEDCFTASVRVGTDLRIVGAGYDINEAAQDVIDELVKDAEAQALEAAENLTKLREDDDD
jgi:hypothetical protein